MSDPISILHCIGCGDEYDVNEVRFRCDCGDLLEVVHDLKRIGAEHPDLKGDFHRRLSNLDCPDNSGVWRYREIILPSLPVDKIVTKGEGNTSLYHTPLISKLFNTKKLYLKHEGENPTLSFKDRGMTAGVSWAHHLGMGFVGCASTGDTSAAMAAYAAQLEDMEGVVFLPDNKISHEQLAQAISYGAKTLAIDTDFDGCMRLVRQVCDAYPIYLLNSMNSFRIEGQKAIGIEAVHQLGWRVPDWFVIPVGNAGNVSALGKGLKELFELGLIDRLPRIAGVQAEAANPLYLSYRTGFSEKIDVTAKQTLASAIRIGAPVSRDKASRVIESFNGVMAQASEAELMAAKALADRAGVAVCPNSGVALAGLLKLRRSGEIADDESVVVILTAHGAKFSEVGVNYHAGTIEGLEPSHPNPPVKVRADLESVVAALGL